MEIDDSDQFAFDDQNAGASANIRQIETQSESENDDEEMTAAEALHALENIWLNEKFAPELLPQQQELVNMMLLQISHLEENIKKLKKGDIRINIHTMEINRIRFIISSYLRSRVNKIEEYAIHLLQNDAERSPEEKYMTPAETQFAREYIASVESLFTSLALQNMPPRIKEFELAKMSSKPNMDAHVFVRANKDIKGVLISSTTANTEEVDFQKDSQHIIPYSAVELFVKDGSVQLI